MAVNLYSCPSCGRTFTLDHKAARVTCRDCRTSWNVSYSKSYGGEVATIVMGAVISAIFPAIGGLMIIVGAVSAYDKKTMK